MAAPKFTSREIDQLNAMAGFFSFIITPVAKMFLNVPHKMISLYTGNQFGKTNTVAYGYVLRIMGRHPIPEKNVSYWRCGCGKKWNWAVYPKSLKCTECGADIERFENSVRTFRFASETLPGQTDGAKGGASSEVKNTQYPAFKKWLPEFLVKKDITARNPAMTLADVNGGPDIIVEYISYNQSTQSTAGTQRLSVWCDEQPPYSFYEEQGPRLLAADGDMVITLTPADRISWMFDEIYERASVYLRSPSIVAKFGMPAREVKRDDNSIAVIQAATDDNPTLKPEVIESLFDKYDDPDVIAIRRYGVFKQVSGRIFKAFSWNTHVINEEKYFPEGIPHEWAHARGIDYHERTPWAMGWMCMSDTDELFIYDEFNPVPDQMVTAEIAEAAAKISRDYRYRLDLVDPLAQKTQSNTGLSVVDDLNRCFQMHKREGICTGAYWQPWDTKSTRGRDQITTRLKNSVAVGKPFCNLVKRNGKTEYLPTIWIFSRCKMFANSFKNWRWEEWSDNTSLTTKEEKNTPMQKWSHFCMVVEGLLKDNRFRASQGMHHGGASRAENEATRYFRRERATA